VQQIACKSSEFRS